MNAELTTLLQRLSQDLRTALGDQLTYITLYGSQARGSARPDSDVDVLLVLKQDTPSVCEIAQQVAYRLMWETDFRYLVTLNIMGIQHYRLLKDKRSSYLTNVEREGQAL